jgi:mRNA interferase RelE/StbE
MKWKIDYAKSAAKFIGEHRISEEVRDLIKNLILRINGKQIKIDLKKLKGKWDGYLRIRKGKIRIILKVHKEEKRIFVKKVDFRGSVY